MKTVRHAAHDGAIILALAGGMTLARAMARLTADAVVYLGSMAF